MNIMAKSWEIVNNLISKLNAVDKDIILNSTCGLIVGLLLGSHLKLALIMVIVVALADQIYDYCVEKLVLHNKGYVALEMSDILSRFCGGLVGIMAVQLVNAIIKLV